MNNLTYFILNRIKEKKIINDKYINSLYKFYIKDDPYRNYKINMNKEEFKKLINIIFDVLRFNLKSSEFEEVITHYIIQLLADSLNGNNVDIDWSIEHIYYLTVGLHNKVDTEKYKNSIMFLQEKLINEFNIEEKFKEKLGRKVYTKLMLKY